MRLAETSEAKFEVVVELSRKAEEQSALDLTRDPKVISM
jgi:hypothetical protein